MFGSGMLTHGLQITGHGFNKLETADRYRTRLYFKQSVWRDWL